MQPGALSQIFRSSDLHLFDLILSIHLTLSLSHGYVCVRFRYDLDIHAALHARPALFFVVPAYLHLELMFTHLEIAAGDGDALAVAHGFVIHEPVEVVLEL